MIVTSRCSSRCRRKQERGGATAADALAVSICRMRGGVDYFEILRRPGACHNSVAALPSTADRQKIDFEAIVRPGHAASLRSGCQSGANRLGIASLAVSTDCAETDQKPKILNALAETEG